MQSVVHIYVFVLNVIYAYMHQVVEILAHLHSNAILWGSDFRPKNIRWIDADQRLKAVCLESCVNLKTAMGGADPDFVGSTFKPSAYMPPEAATSLRRTEEREKPVPPSVASDYWALGMILLEIERGGVHFFRRTRTSRNRLATAQIIDRLIDYEQLERDITETLESVSSAPLRSLLAGLLALSPEQRLAGPSPAEMLDSDLFRGLIPHNFVPPALPPTAQAFEPAATFPSVGLVAPSPSSMGNVNASRSALPGEAAAAQHLST